MAKWDIATSDPEIIADWWRVWPDALPGIPLARMGWAVVDADRREGKADGVAAVTDIGCLGPHSKIATPSGGLHLVFAQPSPPIAGRFNWCEGVEILGEGCLLTCYDLEELKFPHVAPRAILPKMFWQPREAQGCCEREPTNKPRPRALGADAEVVADLTAALGKLDPRDWRGQHDEWLMLMAACQAEGVECEDFVRWSTRDPHYCADGPIIRRKWASLKPGHGGALFAALAQRGIRIAKQGQLIGGHPIPAATPATTINLKSRLHSIQREVEQAEGTNREPMLFWGSCRCAEIIAEPKTKLTPSNAMALLESSAKVNGLWKEIGADEVRRTIANGLRHVELRLLDQPA
jgi:hypothetical protein